MKSLMTINQLLDEINELKIDSITPAIGKIRQNLINHKKESAKGGLIKVDQTHSIMLLISHAKFMAMDIKRIAIETAAHTYN